MTDAASIQANLRPRRHCALTGREEACLATWRPFAIALDCEDGTGTYRILRCGECDAGLTDPLLPADKLGLLYAAKSSSDFDHIGDSPVDALKDYLARRELAGILPRGAAVLDYGTGNGRFAIQARAAGAGTVLAVDHQDQAPPALAGGLLPYAAVGDFEKTDLTFDVILLRHVLEHAPEPVELLQSLGRRLRPGGFVSVEVPNVDSASARVFGARWPGHYVPRHIHHFSAASLRRVAAAAGLATSSLTGKELPLMGNLLSAWLGLPRAHLACKLVGIPLFAVQRAVEALGRSSSCLAARLSRPPGS